MDNYPIGAANDPKAPYNKPLPIKVKAEVGVELGLFVDVEVPENSEKEEVEEAVEKEIFSRFKSDDVEISNIRLYQYDIFSESK